MAAGPKGVGSQELLLQRHAEGSKTQGARKGQKKTVVEEYEEDEEHDWTLVGDPIPRVSDASRAWDPGDVAGVQPLFPWHTVFSALLSQWHSVNE
jgi:hypothetical protein